MPEPIASVAPVLTSTNLDAAHAHLVASVDLLLNAVEAGQPLDEHLLQVEASRAVLAHVTKTVSAQKSVETDRLVDRFSEAVKAKLARAEAKHGWRNAWAIPDWEIDCRTDLSRHVTKGDPLDVAAYAAFCWHHGWSTAMPVKPIAANDANPAAREPAQQRL